MSDRALTPEEDAKPKVGATKKMAGGIPAVLSAMKHSQEEMGMVRGTLSLLKVNQRKGFDCPGCAWPDPDDKRAMTEFCENGAKAVAEEATIKKVTPEFFATHTLDEIASKSDYWIGKQGRLTHPMLLDSQEKNYQQISWAEAYQLIAEELKQCENPDQSVFYTSGRTSNEAAFMYQLFIRKFGTNNLPDCSNMCHESSGVALNESLGIGKGSVKLDDFEKADLVLVIGQNPGTNHPKMLSELQKASRNGCKIVSINPLLEAGLKSFTHPQEPLAMIGGATPISSHYYQVKIAGDFALFKALGKYVLEKTDGQGLDMEFIKTHTSGFESYVESVKNLDYESLSEQCGLTLSEIFELGDLIMESKKMICCWAMGLTQQKHGVATIQEVVNLLLLGGHLGREGAGVCPVRGHSNVQGDRTMGIYEKPPQDFLNKLEDVYGFQPPQNHGYDVVDCIKAMHEGKVRVFMAMGGNFLSASPDTVYTAEALSKTSLTVHVSTKLNRSHLVTGKRALILPAYGRTDIDLKANGEQAITVENSMGYVHKSQGHLKPGSPEQKSEVEIICELAHVMYPEDQNLPWLQWKDNYDLIRDEIEKVVPGFENFNDKLKQEQGFYLYNAVRDELVFNTESKKAQFSSAPLETVDEREGAKYAMMTIRTHDQYNTTIYGMDDRYRGLYEGRRVVLMNYLDIQSEGIKPGQYVDLKSTFQGQVREAKRFIALAYNIPRGCIATYYPETNVLVPIDRVALRSNTPTSKLIPVDLSRSEDQN